MTTKILSSNFDGIAKMSFQIKKHTFILSFIKFSQTVRLFIWVSGTDQTTVLYDSSG